MVSLRRNLHDLVMEIRNATEADLPEIVAIYNESIPGGTSTADLEPITVDSRWDWFSKFDPNKRPIWVAVSEEGKVAGCIYLSSFYGGRRAYDQTAEVSVYLASDYQGKGLGTLLKQRMIAACPRLGVEVLLSFYFDHNQATQRLNNNLGFVEVGHLPEIADVFGKKRGLKIGMLKISAI